MECYHTSQLRLMCCICSCVDNGFHGNGSFIMMLSYIILFMDCAQVCPPPPCVPSANRNSLGLRTWSPWATKGGERGVSLFTLIMNLVPSGIPPSPSQNALVPVATLVARLHTHTHLPAQRNKGGRRGWEVMVVMIHTGVPWPWSE